MDAPEAGRNVRRWLEARERGDLVSLRRLTAEDAEWVSPVNGPVTGRDRVLDQVAAAFTDTDRFATETISVEVRGDRAVAVVRNTGRRGTRELDSLQTLFVTLRAGLVERVRIAVDEPDQVEAFWSSG